MALLSPECYIQKGGVDLYSVETRFLPHRVAAYTTPGGGGARGSAPDPHAC